jgi:leucyl-tRNA synthetase
MIALNELGSCSKRAVLEPLTILLSPFAPHIAEELWHQLGHEDSVVYAAFPEYKQELTVDSSVNYPVSFNGKSRFFLDAPAQTSPAEVEALVRAHEKTPPYVGELSIAKVIVVPGRIVNVVLKK